MRLRLRAREACGDGEYAVVAGPTIWSGRLFLGIGQGVSATSFSSDGRTVHRCSCRSFVTHEISCKTPLIPLDNRH